MTAPDLELLTGWGRTSPSAAHLRRPSSVEAASSLLASAGPRGALPRGLGRSYGDVAQNGGGIVVDMTALSGIERFDRDAGTITAPAGTSLDAIVRATLPAGWFLPVTPGTRFVTLGGAIANDVHGKNHHRDGAFGAHVVTFDLLTADGAVRTITPGTDAFAATVGGIGLTGIVIRATIRLLRVETASVRVDTERATDLEDLMARMEAGDDAYRYSVAWIDCIASGRALGRGVLTRGDHASLSELPARATRPPLAFAPATLPGVPPSTPKLVSAATARAFNEAWFRKAPRERHGEIRPLAPFFYPLDAVGSWNRLYGRHGFVQHQFVVPFGEEAVLQRVIERLVARRVASLLGVLKRFGPGTGLLSFPIEGWTLALDLPAAQPALRAVLAGIDREVADAGGRVYLAKDARLDPSLLAAMYPELDRWRELRDRLDPHHVWRSDLARRLGIDAPVGTRHLTEGATA
ncbi:MAG: FAD-binding protein [Actinomycetota bacterium]